MADDKAKNDEVREEKPKTEQGAEDFKEKFLRMAAEFDNYKRRTRNDVDSAKRIGKAEILRQLLLVLDEFELALMNANTNRDENNNFMKGVEMVYSNFLETLKREGLSEMKATGAFDPYRHEIIMTREDPKRKPGTIIEVTKKGYVFGDLVLRPASVIVAKEKEKNGSNGDKTENEKQK
jgi:molecular chaperone GrpE